ncbi:MAG: C39 family peptidase [Chloroflexota bacterium]
MGIVAALFGWLMTTRAVTNGDLVDGVPRSFLAPPSAPSLDWRSPRAPLRTHVAPAETVASGPVWAAAATDSTVRWVQTHRASGLFSTPTPESARDAELGQWTFLRVLEARPGWLRVGYGADEAGRPSSIAWVPETDVGESGPPSRFVASVVDTQLWAHEGSSANAIASVPQYATLERAGPERNGKIAVRLGDPARSGYTTGWVEWSAVRPADEPDINTSPLDVAYAPFSTTVRLDVPYRTQLDGSLSSASNCGPTSVAMAMHAFGVNVPTTRARALANQAMGVYDPWGGTTLESLQAVARANGFEGLDLHENGRYRRWTLDDVRRHLRAGHPIIPELRYRLIPGREWFAVSYDHYVVITGMVGDDFIYNDPAVLDGRGERVMSGAALTRAWLGSDHPGAGLAVARPL